MKAAIQTRNLFLSNQEGTGEMTPSDPIMGQPEALTKEGLGRGLHSETKRSQSRTGTPRAVFDLPSSRAGSANPS